MQNSETPHPSAKTPGNPGWELFAHDADIGVRGHGRSLAEALENAALAMMATITDLGLIEGNTMVEVQCTAPNNELLLYEWLNAIVFEVATQDLLFSHFEVEVRDHRLSGKLFGEPIDIDKHQPAVEVKGATLTQLHVSRDHEGHWQAQCVVDV